MDYEKIMGDIGKSFSLLNESIEKQKKELNSLMTSAKHEVQTAVNQLKNEINNLSTDAKKNIESKVNNVEKVITNKLDMLSNSVHSQNEKINDLLKRYNEEIPSLKGMFKQQQSFILKIKNAVQQINGILNG
jgi:Tfp pilus assembly protein PilP